MFSQFNVDQDLEIQLRKKSELLLTDNIEVIYLMP